MITQLHNIYMNRENLKTFTYFTTNVWLRAIQNLAKTMKTMGSIRRALQKHFLPLISKEKFARSFEIKLLARNLVIAIL